MEKPDMSPRKSCVPSLVSMRWSRLKRAKEGESHRSYLDLYRHIQESDKVLSECFDKWSRSHALVILTNWRSENLLTDEEFTAFSAETRKIVELFLKRV